MNRQRLLIFTFLLFPVLGFAFNQSRCEDIVRQHIKRISDNTYILRIDFEMQGPFQGYTDYSRNILLALSEGEASYVAFVNVMGGSGIDRYIVDQVTCDIKNSDVLYSE